MLFRSLVNATQPIERQLLDMKTDFGFSEHCLKVFEVGGEIPVALISENLPDLGTAKQMLLFP